MIYVREKPYKIYFQHLCRGLTTHSSRVTCSRVFTHSSRGNSFARATWVNRRPLVDYDFKMRLPCAQILTCITDGISRCCEVNLNLESKKTFKFGIIWRFLETGFRFSATWEAWAIQCTCPNLTRMMHLI